MDRAGHILARVACILGCASALSSVGGCASTLRMTAPLEPARGLPGLTGFGRATTYLMTEDGLSQGGIVTTRVGQAATVEPGPRGDRLWRVAADGSQLEYCQLLDDHPYDCTPVLPLPAYEPAIVEPTNLGWANVVTSYSDGRTTWVSSSGSTSRAGFMPATPRFGVWVANTALRALPIFDGGVIRLGSALGFCHVLPEKGPSCQLAEHEVSGIVAVRVLRRAGRFVHVAWAQVLGTEDLMRCEADDEDGQVKCQLAKEVNGP